MTAAEIFKAPCLFCAESKKLKLETFVDVVHVTCESCKAHAPLYQWNHPVSQSQVCLICSAREESCLKK